MEEGKKTFSRRKMLRMGGGAALIAQAEQMTQISEAKSPLGQILIFQDAYSPHEKEFILRKVQEQIEYYRQDPYLETIIKNVKKWQEVILQAENELDFKLNPALIQVIPALIFVESKGNPRAQSPYAQGLCQLQWATANETAKRLGLGKNLFDPKTNIKLCMGYLDELNRLFPEPGLTLLVYNWGMGNMSNTIVNILQDRGVSQAAITSVLTDPQKGTASLVREYSLNLVQVFKTANMPLEAREYVPKIAAAHLLLN